MTNFFERELKIISMFKHGHTMEAIGLKFSLSRERVRQILAANNIYGCDGGKHSVVLKQRMREQAYRDSELLPKYSCTRAEYKEIQNKNKKLPLAFIDHFRNAIARGIRFKLTFPEWYKLWNDSGHIDNRGRKSGQYVMSRKGDKGPYSIDNIEIKSCNENCKEAMDRIHRLHKIHKLSKNYKPQRMLKYDDEGRLTY